MAPVNAVFILLVGFVCSTFSTACPGCSVEENPNSPTIHLYLKSTLTHYKAPAKGTDNELTSLLRVTKVTSQVVAGMLYKYDFEARGVKSHKLYTCHIEVLSQPWAQGNVVEEYQCTPLYLNRLAKYMVGEKSEDVNSNEDLTKKLPHVCAGCAQEVNINDPQKQHYLKTTLTHFKAPAKGTENELTTLVRVTKITTQVVSGIKTTYEFEAKGVKTHKLYTCHMEVLSQPWAGGDFVDDYHCKPLYL